MSSRAQFLLQLLTRKAFRTPCKSSVGYKKTNNYFIANVLINSHLKSTKIARRILQPMSWQVNVELCPYCTLTRIPPVIIGQLEPCDTKSKGKAIAMIISDTKSLFKLYWCGKRTKYVESRANVNIFMVYQTVSIPAESTV